MESINLYDDKSFALSQTALKDWKTMPPSVWFDQWIMGNRKFKRKRSMDFGSLLDTFCYSPDLYEKRFIVAEAKKPSIVVENILHDVYDAIAELNSNIKDLNKKNGTKVPLKKYSLTDNKELVQKYCKEHDYYSNNSEQAFNTITKTGKEYFEFMKKLGHKVAISQVDEDDAKKMKEILFTDPATKGFFIPRKECEVIFQQQIRAEFPIGMENIENIPIKGMLDTIHFNHKKKIVREVDLKFTEDVFQFASYNGPVRLFDYPLQHSFYDFLLREFIKTYKDGAYADYTIAAPFNVVIDRKLKVPYIYRYSFDDLHIKRKGVEGTQIRGWESVLEEIAWHINENNWTRPREHVLHGTIGISIYAKK